MWTGTLLRLRLGLLLVLGSLILSTPTAWGEPEDVWNTTYGGPGHEVGGMISEAGDGGYILTGMTESYGAGNCDLWILKIDSNGSRVWDRPFGGTGIDVGVEVQKTSDGGYIIVGYTTSGGAGGKDAVLVKTDSNGDAEWGRTFGGRGDDVASSVREAKGGGYVFAGSTDSYGIGKGDVWLVKTDRSGVEEWNRTFGGPGDDEGMAIVEAEDGGYLIAGRTDSYGSGGYDGWLVKTDTQGKIEWERTFGGPKQDGFTSIEKASDGGYVICGFSNSFGAGDFDVWLLKVGSEGDQEWSTTFGGPAGDFGNSVRGSDDGGYIVAGWTSQSGSRTSPDEALLIKVDPNGTEEWVKSIGGDGVYSGISAIQMTDGGYLLSGFSNRRGAGGFDFWVMKLI